LRNSVEEIDVGKVDEDKDTSSSAETAGDKYSNISKVGQRCLNKLIRSGCTRCRHGRAAWQQLFLFSKLNGRIRLHETAFLPDS